MATEAKQPVQVGDVEAEVGKEVRTNADFF